MIPEIDKYVGLPYNPKGTDLKNGIDCYNLVRVLYNDFFNVELPALLNYPDEKDKAVEIIDFTGLGDEVSLSDMKFGDFVLMRTFFVPQIALHIGMAINRRDIIHTASRGVVISNVQMLKRFILGVYRLKDDYCRNKD